MARGLDHVVVAVNDHNEAGRVYADLGFTVTPENRHSWGTANRLVQLDGFFIELLGIAEPGLIPEHTGNGFSFGAFNRDFLKEREGGSMLVLESQDPDRDRADFQKAGLHVFDPFSFERNAHYADGSKAPVGFDLTILRDPLAPHIGYFTCHNRFPQNFWKPDFQKHANGASRVKTVHFLAGDPSDHHEFFGGFTGLREMRATSLGLELETPRGRISIYNPAAYRAVLGDAAADAATGSLPQIAALEVACSGLAEQKIIPATRAGGMTLILSPEE